MIELLEDSALAKNISNSIHFNAFFLADILERIQLTCFVVLDYSHLEKGQACPRLKPNMFSISEKNALYLAKGSAADDPHKPELRERN